MRTFAIVAVLFASFFSFGILMDSAATGQEYQGIRDHVLHLSSQTRYQGIKNSYEKIERIIGEDDVRQRWQVITTYADYQGRVRWETQEGKFDSQKNKVSTVSYGFVYDGKLSCRYDFSFSPKDGPRKGKETHAVIREGTPLTIIWPRGQWVANGDIVFELLSYEERKGQISFLLESISDEENVKRLTIPQYSKSRLVSWLDAGAGGLESRREVYNQREKLSRKVIRTFKKYSEENLWVTDVEIIVDHATEENGKRIPEMYYETHLQDLRLNSPDFDESMLSITLAPGTFVHDTRYDVHYRVGDEKVIEAEINAAAQQAIAEQKEDPLTQPYNAILAKELLVDTDVDKTIMIPTKPEQSGRMLWIVIAVNVLVFVSLLLVFRFVRR